MRSESLTIVTESFPPYNYSQDGQITGMSTEVVNAVLKEMGLKIEIQMYPWARAYKLAEKSRNHLIYSIARIPEREAIFHWIGPIAPYKTSFYKLISRRDIQVSELNEAKQYSIGCSRDDVITQYLQSKAFKNLSVVSRDTQNIMRLKAGLVDLIAFDEASFTYQVKQLGLNLGLFQRVHRLEDLSDSLYMALNRASDERLVNQLNHALDAIKKSGEYEAIQKRYY